MAMEAIELRLAPESEELSGNFLLSEVSAAGSEKAGSLQVKGELPVSFRYVMRDGALHFATGSLTGQKNGAIPLSFLVGDRARGKVDLAVQGKALFHGPQVRVQSRVQLSQGHVDLPGQQLMISGIKADIPLQLPWDKKGEEQSGSGKVEAVRWQGRNLAGIGVKIRQRGSIYRYAGEMRDRVLGGAPITISGKVDLSGDGGPALDGTLQLRKFHLDGFLLRQVGLEQDVKCSGIVSADARGTFKQGRLQAEATLAVEEGKVEWPKKAMEVNGLNAAVTFAELPSFRSLPAMLRFASVKEGELEFGAGAVNFQVESGRTILVEKGRCRWCGGTVQAMAMRLPLTGEQVAADLYCDRLNLAELLQQFGIREVRGSGTVNGHIPVSYGDGKFLFEDGFLYSTPGGGGTIQVKALDLLTAGIPKNSPQYAQLDFATAALRDFAYNWVKLSLVSEGDDVVMKMNIDGKPAHPLPFYYDQKSGTFNRLKVSSEKGIDQPIVLDVNFRIPFNQLLGYGKSIKQVIDLMQ